MEATKIRSILPELQQSQFDDIVLQRVLGASRHISMIGEMLCAVANKHRSTEANTTQMFSELYDIANYFKKTRGEASRAVGNAIDYMTRNFLELRKQPIEVAIDGVEKAICTYNADASVNVAKLVDFATTLSQEMSKIFIYDYSSTVNTFLTELGNKTTNVEVYIAESRIINGGYAFVPTALAAGMKVHFIPDAAIAYYLKDCDAAFFGAETYLPDGTAYNTTGSDIVALVCRENHVPLYVLTPLIKLDTRALEGYQREPVNNNTCERMRSAGFTNEEIEKVDFDCPELLPVGPESITAFITEQGIIPSTSLFYISMQYAAFLQGENIC